jgi:hypothetical protein
MYDMVIYLLEEGVLGLAKEINDGVQCEYWIDGVSYSETFETNEYTLVLDL